MYERPVEFMRPNPISYLDAHENSVGLCWGSTPFYAKYYRLYLCEQVPRNEQYELEAMPVPVVMVALAGGIGGRVVERASGREIEACEGGVFFLPAYTAVVVCSGSGEGIQIALAHTNLHWGTLATPSGGARRKSCTDGGVGSTISPTSPASVTPDAVLRRKSTTDGGPGSTTKNAMSGVPAPAFA